MSEPCEWCDKPKLKNKKFGDDIRKMFPRSLISDPMLQGKRVDTSDNYAEESIWKFRQHFCLCPEIGHIFPDGSEYKGGDPKNYPLFGIDF
jgi:hypothetical protein